MIKYAMRIWCHRLRLGVIHNAIIHCVSHKSQSITIILCGLEATCPLSERDNKLRYPYLVSSLTPRCHRLRLGVIHYAIIDCVYYKSQSITITLCGLEATCPLSEKDDKLRYAYLVSSLTPWYHTLRYNIINLSLSLSLYADFTLCVHYHRRMIKYAMCIWCHRLRLGVIHYAIIDCVWFKSQSISITLCGLYATCPLSEKDDKVRYAYLVSSLTPLFASIVYVECCVHDESIIWKGFNCLVI